MGQGRTQLNGQEVGTSSPGARSPGRPIVEPFIKAEQDVPETTVKSIVLGIILAIILAGSNAYLGLKMGQTISASIPAAVISMAVLRLFRESSILENNIVQTIASAGEVVAAGIIFTIPALIVMGYWHKFDYWQITAVSIIGGTLGVMYSVPLRRALIVESDLKFPEGVATAEVLKVGELQKTHARSDGVRLLLNGAAGAAAFKFFQSGLHLFTETIGHWFRVGPMVFGLNCGLSLSMIGAGFIVGLKVAINLIVGSAIAWFVAVPFYALWMGGPEGFGLASDVSAFDFAMAIRGEKVRFIGVGTMITGGLWALVSLVQPIKAAIISSIDALKQSRQGISVKPLRTDHDIPLTWVALGIALLGIPLTLLFNLILSDANLNVSPFMYGVILTFLTLMSLLIGFVCAAIGGYMAGLVGSSANPLSGITIGAILIVSLCLLMLTGSEIAFGSATQETLSLAAVVIMIGGIVAVSASFSGDNLQDLKSGQLVGSTPWRQQATLIVGAIAGGFVVAPILQLLFDAYGMGGVFPREGMDPTFALAAPQATLMASVAQGIFEQTLDLVLIGIGVVIGILIILVDKLILEPRKSAYHLSVLAIALGIYLPLDVTLPLIVGGIISFLASQKLHRSVGRENLSVAETSDVLEKVQRRGLLFSAGMIAGDALVGILLAIPFAAYQSTDVLSVVGPGFAPFAILLGGAGFSVVALTLFRLGSRRTV